MTEQSPKRHVTRAPCSSCGGEGGEFAPSGRHVTCEAAVDIPTAVDNQPMMQIGAVSQLVTLSLRTVRHYEDAGLVRPAARTAGGFRLYGQDTVARLLLIKQMKPLGFTLEEMRLLIETRDRMNDPDLDADERTNLRERVALFSAATTEKVRQLRKQLATAEAFAAALQKDIVET
ncbi:MAG TPA: MerR family transcriptional regulator [Acidimicrobiales bacterium]|nr:MerR family transcriptional regulator [Acidimicrobiales bacterium]